MAFQAGLFAIGFLSLSSACWGSAINCTLPNWSWASNSLGQNPCAIVELLESACYGLTFILQPLHPGINYVTPQQNATPTCECNTVMYSLFQACTACQNATIEPWTFYEQNCPTVYVSQYPSSIPKGTKIPYWAYLNVTTTDYFDPTAAATAGDEPENDVKSSPISTGTSQSTSTHGSKLNIGALVGGTLAGIAVIILIGAFSWMLYRQRKIQNERQPRQFPTTIPRVPIDRIFVRPETVEISRTEISRPYYNPDDPSTYPDAVESSASYSDPSKMSSPTIPRSAISPLDDVLDLYYQDRYNPRSGDIHSESGHTFLTESGQTFLTESGYKFPSDARYNYKFHPEV